VSSQGFQGTSCDYQGNIVGDWHCDMTSALPLCHTSSQCPSGKTCLPYDAGVSNLSFQACQ
jgi:hypothetical protein